MDTQPGDYSFSPGFFNNAAMRRAMPGKGAYIDGFPYARAGIYEHVFPAVHTLLLLERFVLPDESSIE